MFSCLLVSHGGAREWGGQDDLYRGVYFFGKKKAPEGAFNKITF